MANTIDFNVGTNAVNVLNQTADAAENTAKGFTSAKAELRALQQQMLQLDASSAEFKKASARASELKDRMEELGENVRVNIGNSFEQASNSVSLFTGRLLGGDLKGAGDALTNLGGAIGKISFKELKQELGGLLKGVKDLGLAVVSNPFFLTVGVLAAIAYNYKDIAKWANQTSLEQQAVAQATEDLNKATEQELLKGAQKITQVEVLTNRVKDNNLTEKERRQALKDLETMYPAYFSNLNGDINDTEALNAAKEKLITNIKAEAKANAAKSLLEAEYAKKLALETEINSKKGKFSQEQINEAIEAARFSQQTFFKEANQNLNDWWDGTEGIGKASLDLEQSMTRIAYLEQEATAAVLANVQTEVKAIHEKTKAATSAAQTEAEKKEAERQKELEANAVKAAKELKQEQDLAAQKLKVRQDYIRANQSAQANELYELELKKEQELQTWEGAEEDKVFIVEKYRLLELEIEKKYDDLALQQQIEAQEKAKAEKDKADEEAKKKQEDQLAAEQQAFNARLSIASSGLDALVALNDAFTKKGQQQSRKQFQIQKALNLASAVIDTYGGINRALNDKTMPSTTARIIQASIVGAMGLANVIKISKTEYGNATTPSGTNMSTGGGGDNGTTAPSPANFAFLQNQPNQQPPLQAYVVSTQVSSNLEAQQLINNQARLGG